jgi:hypothetical protein
MLNIEITEAVEQVTDIRVLCTHVFDGGHACASPALRGETFCYYHHPTRPRPDARRLAHSSP